MLNIIPKAWSDVSPPDKVVWILPNGTKHGIVVERKGRSLVVQFWEEHRLRTIPDAHWYYFNYRQRGPDVNEALFVVDEFPHQALTVARITENDSEQGELHASDIAEMLRMPEKQVRRHLRNGVWPQAWRSSQDGRWLVSRSHMIEVAVKRGWL